MADKESKMEKQIDIIAEAMVRLESRVEDIHGDLKGRIETIEARMATKDDIARLETILNAGLGRRMEETDRLRDRVQLLEIRVDKPEVAKG